MKRILLMVLLLVSGVTLAIDNPTVILDDHQYNQSICIQEEASNCVNTLCLNSEDRDCSQKCQANAENKCGPTSNNAL